MCTKFANPRGVEDLVLSSTGQYCFTFNKEDESFVQWTVDPQVLEDQQNPSSNTVKDFLSVLPDKTESKLFSDMKDFFCYIQIEKGATALSNKLPIEDIANLFRALGYYPTDKEVEDITNEVKYSDYVNTGKLRVDVGLEECLKLFINHKPVKGEDISELQKVFKVIGKGKDIQDQTPTINRNDFINFLRTRGEIFKEKDFVNCVKPLFDRKVSEDKTGEAEAEEFYNISEEEISYNTFTNDVLKIPESLKADSRVSKQNLQIVLDEQEPTIKA